MITIGILGANGQVGSEVCLMLSQMPGVSVIPICRSTLASTLLRRCGLECRHGTLDKASEAAHLLAGCHLVADFTLPQNSRVSDLRAAIKQTITAVMQHAPAGIPLVYISSLMAFGVGPGDSTLKPRILSRTLYGSNKRYAESLAFGLGKRFGREVYALRLGQVHGELQSVSRSLLRRLNETAYIPLGRSYAVFAYTIAESLVNIAEGREKPGRYSLISEPAWSWAEIYDYYAQRAGVKAQIVTFELAADTKTIGSRFRATARRVADPAIQFAGRHRELLTSYLLQAFPTLEQRSRAVWGLRRAQAEVSQMMMLKRRGQYRPFNIQIDEVPGKRLASLSDCRTTMDAVTSNIREVLQAVDVGEQVSALANHSNEKHVLMSQRS